MSSTYSSPHDQGAESDEIDLLTITNRITVNSRNAPNASIPIGTPREKDDEPDWVREFSQSLPNEKERREALASQFDEDDDDSIIDLVPDDPDPLPTQPSLASNAQPSQDERPEKPRLKRQKASTAPCSQLPLTVAPKLDESIVLLQSADQSLDLSGDVGAVGRVKMQHGVLYLDIKGTIYKADTTACNTACVVTVGEDEAKVTAILDEAVTLVSKENLFAPTDIVLHGELQEEAEENNTEEDQSNEGEPKSKKRKLSEKAEKGRGRGQIRPRATTKNARTKK